MNKGSRTTITDRPPTHQRRSKMSTGTGTTGWPHVSYTDWFVVQIRAGNETNPHHLIGSQLSPVHLILPSADVEEVHAVPFQNHVPSLDSSPNLMDAEGVAL
jgi:hypothetical protein